MKKIISTNNMNKHTLANLSKSQLINLLLKQNVEIQKFSKKIDNTIPPPVEFKDNYKPVPTPRKSIKQMVQDYEDNIIQPPTEFRDDYKPVPAPRKSVKQMAQDYEDNIIQPPTEFRDDYKPIP